MKTKTRRTYYGFQMCSAYDGPMDVVTTHKPKSGYQVKCRAASLAEARERLDTAWIQQCYEAMGDEDLAIP